MYSSHLPQLFLLHYAGGNVYSFNFLKKYLEPHFEVVCIELPGRGKRMLETILKDKKEAVNDQYNEIQKYRKKGVDFAIYGHSMGAILGLGVTCLLQKNMDAPINLIVTGNSGPGTDRQELRYNLDSEGFMDALKELGGIPDEVYENKELFDFFEPILRADFEIIERHIDEELETINCPIYCVMGSEEKYVSRISNWKNFTNNIFEYEIFEGNHFFINNHPEKLAQFIQKAYNDTLVL